MLFRSTYEEITLVNSSNFQDTVFDTQQEATRPTVRSLLVPKELFATLKAAQFEIGEILLKSLLQENYVYPLLTDVIFDLSTATDSRKPPGIPAHGPHWETGGRTRAWRAGVLRRFGLGPKGTEGPFFFR